MQTLNIIGAGKVGQALASRWYHAKTLQIGAVCNRHSTDNAIANIGAGTPATLNTLPDADFTLIATPDDQIALIAQSLDARAGIVFHASGALGANILRPLTPVASCHPIMSFADAEPTLSYVLLEGDDTAIAALAPLFTAIGANPIQAPGLDKTLYHAALSMASNYLVSLTDISRQLLTTAGIAEKDASALLAPLMQQSLQNALSLPAAQALTGPITRGDVNTVAQHLRALHGHPQYPVYCALGLATLEIAKAHLSKSSYLQLKGLLGNTLSALTGIIPADASLEQTRADRRQRYEN
jgi:predicted short-subunit dehydrogenase-like oxidoreductase (DUF2520 family)